MKTKKPLRAINKKKSFSKMSLSDKRIAIAKDVIERIRAKQFVGERGVLWKFQEGALSNFKDAELQNVILKKTQCEVCVKGGLFMSCIRYTDNFLVEDLNDSGVVKLSGNAKDSIEKIFTEEQLSMMESAYEMSKYNWNDIGNANACISFGSKYKTNNARMIAICKNLIKNKGEFIP